MANRLFNCFVGNTNDSVFCLRLQQMKNQRKQQKDLKNKPKKAEPEILIPSSVNY